MMKTIAASLALLLFSATSTAGQGLSVQDVLRYRIEAVSPEVHVGDPLLIRMWLKNISHEEVSVAFSTPLVEELRIHVMTSDGSLVPPTRPLDIVPVNGYTFARHQMAPGSEVQYGAPPLHQINLGSLGYANLAPATYTIVVAPNYSLLYKSERIDPSGADGSNRIQITVVK
jgi:hypothetical protein